MMLSMGHPFVKFFEIELIFDVSLIPFSRYLSLKIDHGENSKNSIFLTSQVCNFKLLALNSKIPHRRPKINSGHIFF